MPPSNFITPAFGNPTMFPHDDFDERVPAHSLDDGGESNPRIITDKVPENIADIDEVDAAIAKQMMELSVEDREKVYMDIHGVKEGPNETEEAIQAGLESMQQEIDKLEDKEAYELARSMDHYYVEDRFLRLSFLRSESYDARKAAIKMVRHFQLKLDLFGKEKLALDIVQDDLDRETVESLYSGKFQMLEAKDRAGRTLGLQVLGQSTSTKTILQRDFYIAMSSIRNPDVQINGIVVVVIGYEGKSIQGSTETHWNATKVVEALPLRVEAIHFCHNSRIIQVLFAIAKAALSPYTKMRTRTHYGTQREIFASLASYGIPLGIIPVEEGCKISNQKACHQRLSEWRSVERLNQPRRQRVIIPSKNDVLFGKGTPFQTHPGNVKLRALVFDRYKLYGKAEKGNKKKIVEEIVKIIHEDSGLFLRPDGESWVCVEDDVAMHKVSTSFRTLSRDLRVQW